MPGSDRAPPSQIRSNVLIKLRKEKLNKGENNLTMAKSLDQASSRPAKECSEDYCIKISSFFPGPSPTSACPPGVGSVSLYDDRTVAPPQT